MTFINFYAILILNNILSIREDFLMKKHIVCLGDSNTHGYCADPADCADGGIRFNESERWTRLLQKHLGEEYLVIEEGLSGRTTCFEDPLHEGLSALNYIYPCLKSHEFVDLLVIMLGTNDVKERFSASAACVAIAMGRGCREKSLELAKYYKEQCDLCGVHFLDAQDLGAEFNTVDYMHLTKKGHAALAENLAKHIPGLL